MSIEIKVPVLPESVTDATIATWHKKPGESIKRDESLVDIETDKVVLEVVAPEDGSLEKVLKEAGDGVTAQEVIAMFKAGAVEEPAKSPSKAEPEKKQPEKQQPEAKPTPAKPESPTTAPITPAYEVSPATRRMMAEQGLDPAQLSTDKASTSKTKVEPQAMQGNEARPEKRVAMTRLRTRIAERLLSAQHNAAILTTFNEVNMKPVMDLRKRYKEKFEKVHQVKLGFMSFFAKAVVEALKRFPSVNASIDGQDIVYHGYFDMGIAVSTPRGLVVPVVRDVDQCSLAEIEKKINELGLKARDGKLSMDEMTGGTFTISNGGTFGSLLSTPILNPPQTGILGMHKIEERAVVEAGEIVIRPMMYLALSYDHRIIDGSESVRFLVTIKELLEDPARLLLDL
jgi:2-oxoglutarate dehydrogenase E2 component (dihydrolipoamide succinyltransferase)